MTDIIFFEKGMFIAKCSAFNNDSFKLAEAIAKALNMEYNVEELMKIKTFGSDYYFIPKDKLQLNKDMPYPLQILGNKIEQYWIGSVNIDITEEIVSKIIKNFTYIND
jgi:hypothetical protein